MPPPSLRPFITVSSLLGLGLTAMLLQAVLENFARSAPDKKREFDLHGVLANAEARTAVPRSLPSKHNTTKVVARENAEMNNSTDEQLEVTVDLQLKT